jgi:serine beta-lactamase-like protein LACTB
MIPAMLTRAFLLLALGSAPVTAQVAAPASASAIHGPTRSEIARVRKIITDTMQALGVPGASISVMVDGQLIWSEGFGLADLEQQVPVTPRTVFRIGSVSKPLSAAALGFLRNRAKSTSTPRFSGMCPAFRSNAIP